MWYGTHCDPHEDIFHCPICNGNGVVSRRGQMPATCVGCGGSGYVWRDRRHDLESGSYEFLIFEDHIKCWRCRGRLYSYDEPHGHGGPCEPRLICCPECDGSGFVPVSGRRARWHVQRATPVVQTRRRKLPAHANPDAIEQWSGTKLLINRFNRYTPAKPGSAKRDPLRTRPLAEIAGEITWFMPGFGNEMSIHLGIYEADWRAAEALNDYQRAADENLTRDLLLQTYCHLTIDDHPAVLAELLKGPRDAFQGFGPRRYDSSCIQTGELRVVQGCIMATVTMEMDGQRVPWGYPSEEIVASALKRSKAIQDAARKLLATLDQARVPAER